MNTLFTYNPKYFTAHYSLFISLLYWVGSQLAGFCLPLPSSSVNMGVVTGNNDGSSISTVMLSPVAAPLPNLWSPMSVSAVEPNKCYRLVSRLIGKVLGVSGSTHSDGDKLVQQTDASQLTQGWRFTPADGGYYSITVLSTQKGIQVANFSSADDALLEQWT